MTDYSQLRQISPRDAADSIPDSIVQLSCKMGDLHPYTSPELEDTVFLAVCFGTVNSNGLNIGDALISSTTQAWRLP